MFAKNAPSKKRRKSRTAFTNQQIYELEKRFLYQKYLTPTDRDEIALSLGLSNAQVITWFQNRRAKLKRDLEERRADVTASTKTSESGSDAEDELRPLPATNADDIMSLDCGEFDEHSTSSPPTSPPVAVRRQRHLAAKADKSHSCCRESRACHVLSGRNIVVAPVRGASHKVSFCNG